MPASPLASTNPSRSPVASNIHADRVADVFYPSSDGKPMAENMWQGDVILNSVGDLRAIHPEALVAADILMYPEEGNRYNNIAPDVLVAFDIGTHKRSTYRVWEEGKPPDWVLEVASPSTGEKDREFKRDYYAAMGVPECWLFDPTGEVHLGMPRLQGFELLDGEYRPLESRLVDGKRMIRSKALCLDVYPDADADGELLRFRYPTTGKEIRHRHEIEAAADRAEAQVEREAARAKQEAERRETAEAQAKQEAERRETAEAQAKQEAVRRETAEARAGQEAARASREAAGRSAAEARVAELEAALRSRIDHPP